MVGGLVAAVELLSVLEPSPPEPLMSLSFVTLSEVNNNNILACDM